MWRVPNKRKKEEFRGPTRGGLVSTRYGLPVTLVPMGKHIIHVLGIKRTHRLAKIPCWLYSIIREAIFHDLDLL